MTDNQQHRKVPKLELWPQRGELKLSVNGEVVAMRTFPPNQEGPGEFWGLSTTNADGKDFVGLHRKDRGIVGAIDSIAYPRAFYLGEDGVEELIIALAHYGDAEVSIYAD